MSLPVRTHENLLSPQGIVSSKGPSSILLDSITDKNFYEDLITVFLQLSRGAGLSTSDILKIQQHMLQAKGIFKESMLADSQKEFENRQREDLLLQPYDSDSKWISVSQTKALLSKIQNELSLVREKQFQYHALRNFVAEKVLELPLSHSKKDCSKFQRFYGSLPGQRTIESLTLDQKLKMSSQQILKSSVASHNQSYDLLRRFVRLKTMFGHRYQEELEEYCQVFNCIFDASEKLVITAGQEGLIKIWSKETGVLLSNLKGHESYIIKIQVTPCNNFLISTASDGIRFFDFNNLTTLGCWVSCSIIDATPVYDAQQSLTIVFAEAKRLMLLKQSVMVQRGKNYEILTLKDFTCFSLQEVNKRQNKTVCQIVINQQRTLILGFQCGQIVIVNYNHLFQPSLTEQLGGESEDIKMLPYLHRFNAHKAEIMEIRWSETCEHFITGCKEGICRVWECRSLEDKPDIIAEIKISKLAPRRKKKQFSCNYVIWNCSYTHIIASFGEIPEADEQQDQKLRGQGDVIVYSFQERKVTCEFHKQFAPIIQLCSISSMDAHPFFPNIVVFSDKGGRVFIVDIFLKIIVNMFQQRGWHLQHPQFKLMPTQIKFSKDGTSFILATQYGTVSIYGYDIPDFYKTTPDEQFLRTDYLPFHIHPQNLRPILANYDEEVKDINEIDRGEVCNMLGAPYRSMPVNNYILYKDQIDRDFKQKLIISNKDCKNQVPQKENSQDASNHAQEINGHDIAVSEEEKIKVIDKQLTFNQLDSIKNFQKSLELKGNDEGFEVCEEFLKKTKIRLDQYFKKQDVFKPHFQQLATASETSITLQNQKHQDQIKNYIKDKQERLKQFQPEHIKTGKTATFTELSKAQLSSHQNKNISSSDLPNFSNSLHSSLNHNSNESSNQNNNGMSHRTRGRPGRRLKRLSDRHEVGFASENKYIEEEFNYNSEKQQDFDNIEEEENVDDSEQQQYEQDSQELYPGRLRRKQDYKRNRPVRAITQNRQSYLSYELEDDDELCSPVRRRAPRRTLIRHSAEEDFKIMQQDNDRVRKKLKKNQQHQYPDSNLKPAQSIGSQSQEGLCARCKIQKATTTCTACKIESFCSNCKFLRGKDNIFLCFACKFERNRDRQEKKNVTQEAYREVERSDKSYIPQIGDQVYYFFQGYEQFLNTNIASLNNSILGTIDKFNIVSHQSNLILMETPLCRIIDVSYHFPLKESRPLVTEPGRRTRNEETKHIQMLLHLQVIEGENILLVNTLNGTVNDSKKQTKTFWLFFLPYYDFIVRKQIFEAAMIHLKNQKFKVDNLVRDSQGQQLQIVDLSPSDDHFPNSMWKYVRVRKTDGKRLRANKTNQKRINLWNIQLDRLYADVQFNTQLTTERDLLALEIQEILNKQFEEHCLFIDYVNLEDYPNYRECVEVGICLLAIQDRLKNRYYRSLDSLKKDIMRLEQNSIKFNGEENEITKTAKELIERLFDILLPQNRKIHKDRINEDESKGENKQNSAEKMDVQSTLRKSKKRVVFNNHDPMLLVGNLDKQIEPSQRRLRRKKNTDDYSQDEYSKLDRHEDKSRKRSYDISVLSDQQQQQCLEGSLKQEEFEDDEYNLSSYSKRNRSKRKLRQRQAAAENTMSRNTRNTHQQIKNFSEVQRRATRSRTRN